MDIRDFECKKYVFRKIEEMYISYYLLKSQPDGIEIFSILVSLFEKGTLDDGRFVFDVSRNENESERIFELICKNNVTPYSLDECLDSIYDILLM